MESQKREDIGRPIVGADVLEALRGCQMSARGFYYELLPLLESGSPYGHLHLSTEELSDKFEVSLHMTRRYLFELKAHKVLKVQKDGSLFSPPLIRQLFKTL